VRLALFLAGLAAFLVVSGVVARVIGAEAAARDEVEDVVKLEARGDAAGTVASIDGCARDEVCMDRITRLVRRVEAPGEVEVLRVDGISYAAVTGRTETARIAWKVGGRLPVVQCVRVKRTGDPLSGYEVSLLRVSNPIDRDADCPD
jgi:hypothetical protein